MAWVKEASGATGSAGTTCTVTVPVGGFPSGHFLALGIMTTATSLPSISVSDTRSNTWTKIREVQTVASGSAHQFHCIIGTTLQAGDTITVTSTTSLSRFACALEEFDDTISSADVGATGNGGGSSSTSLTTSTTSTTTNATELVVGVMGLVSAARIYTPNVSYTGGTKISSTGGSGDRAVIVQWKYVSSTGTQVSNGTVNTGTIYAATVETYVISGGGGARSGNANVWNGSTWVAHPAKVWDGGSWVTHPAKGWDGSSWIVGK